MTVFLTDAEQLLRHNATLAEFRALLVSFRGAGGTREEALRLLAKLRTRVQTEEAEDRLLEVMDLVVGHCRPDLRVW